MTPLRQRFSANPQCRARGTGPGTRSRWRGQRVPSTGCCPHARPRGTCGDQREKAPDAHVDGPVGQEPPSDGHRGRALRLPREAGTPTSGTLRPKGRGHGSGDLTGPGRKDSKYDMGWSPRYRPWGPKRVRTGRDPGCLGRVGRAFFARPQTAFTRTRPPLPRGEVPEDPHAHGVPELSSSLRGVCDQQEEKTADHGCHARQGQQQNLADRLHRREEGPKVEERRAERAGMGGAGPGPGPGRGVREDGGEGPQDSGASAGPAGSAVKPQGRNHRIPRPARDRLQTTLQIPGLPPGPP